jgi:hypothetical protein
MKRLVIIALLLMAVPPAQAQLFIGGSGNYGRSHGYVGIPGGNGKPLYPPLTPEQISCYRANYASTFAMQRCADDVLRSRMSDPLTRCLNRYASTNQLWAQRGACYRKAKR